MSNRQTMPRPAISIPSQEPIAITDERIPLPIRKHGERFRKPARFAVTLGNGEYVLLAEDGECLDVVGLP
jgi:hypothetical protein